MALLFSFKVFIISTFVLFTALRLDISVSLITQFLATHVPLTWNFFLLCFKPPYLILLINAIIIAVAISSKFHHSYHPTPPLPFKPPPPPPPPVEEDHPAHVDLIVKPVDVKNEENLTESTWTPPKKEESTETPPPPTLDDVWRKITEGRAMELKKSETFKVKEWKDIPVVCTTATISVKNPLSHDELNQRVDGFIRKINEDMI